MRDITIVIFQQVLHSTVRQIDAVRNLSYNRLQRVYQSLVVHDNARVCQSLVVHDNARVCLRRSERARVQELLDPPLNFSPENNAETYDATGSIHTLTGHSSDVYALTVICDGKFCLASRCVMRSLNTKIPFRSFVAF